ncbi:alpha/beta hydrolase [Curtobacterium sp. B18]|uniref:alpha/beta hydrolase n=1 Tax=Curtobacterium sp. B18 TaxID=95614 RepID=UPI00034B1319|nr:alpha/beta hydrolase [Curtobacterium sp. B18]
MSGEEPDVGDPAGITALGKHWHDRADAVQDALAKIASASDVTASPTWKGDAQTRFAALLDEMRPSASGLVALFDAAGDAFDQYAKDVQRIKDDADAIRLQRGTVAAELAGQQLTLPTLRSAAKADDATEADARSLANAERAIADAGDRSAALDAQWEQLVQDRTTADQALLRVITGPETLGRLGSIEGRGVGASDDDLASMLASLSPTELGALLMLDRTLADRIADMSPDEVAALWKTLGGGKDTTGAEHTAAQDALIASLPAVVGNLAGLPAWARDRANRMTLVSAVAQAEQDLADAKERREGLGWPASQAADQGIEAAQANLDAYRNIEKTLASTKKPGRALLTLATDHKPPLAAVAVGDVDTAENVTYMVPGMGTTTKDTSGWTTAAQNLWQTQELSNAAGTSHAVVAWMNYEAPPVPPASLGVLHGDAARTGADRLAGDLQGFRASRDEQPVLNLVGHSYGTTTAANALHDHGVHVDAFVSVASAGLENSIHGAKDLGADHVYAGQGTDGIPFSGDKRDDWAGTGRMLSGRQDPMQPSFGAETFGTNGGADTDGGGVTTHDPLGYRGDTGYFNLNTESLRNVARATFEDGRGMTPADAATPTVLDDWADTPGGPSLGGRR